MDDCLIDSGRAKPFICQGEKLYQHNLPKSDLCNDLSFWTRIATTTRPNKSCLHSPHHPDRTSVSPWPGKSQRRSQKELWTAARKCTLWEAPLSSPSTSGPPADQQILNPGLAGFPPICQLPLPLRRTGVCRSLVGISALHGCAQVASSLLLSVALGETLPFGDPAVCSSPVAL